MEYFFDLLEIIGTVAFAISGSLLAVEKRMDLFGVCVMGLTTACGGGVIRDLFLGQLPPTMFLQPVYAVMSILVSIIVFFISTHHTAAAVLEHSDGTARKRDVILLLSDSIGLGIFSASGVSAAIQAGYGPNLFFVISMGAMTGVGGGVLRDIMAGLPPYIFVKHIYAIASIIGAIVCAGCWRVVGRTGAMVICCIVVMVIRLLAAKYRWSLPRA